MSCNSVCIEQTNRSQQDCNCACNNNCVGRSGNFYSINIRCVGQNCQGFKWTINSASFTSTTGLAIQENTMKFNKEKSLLTVHNCNIPFNDIVNSTIMVTGENKNGEKKSMVTKVVAVMHKNYDTVLKVSNKGLIAKGKTAQMLVRNASDSDLPGLPGDKWDYWGNASMAILSNMAFDNNNIHPIPIDLETPAHINIINKNDRTFSLTLKLDDGNKRTVMEKDSVITTMTQKNMLKKIKDDNEANFFKVVTMSFNGKAGLALIKKVEVLKNNKYKLELIADKKKFNRLSDNTTIKKLTYTSVEKVRTQQDLGPARFLNSLCAINSRQRHCGGFCTWCGDKDRCRYTCAPI